MASNHALEAERLITAILEDAEKEGITFVIFGGWRNGSLGMEASDIDIFFKSGNDIKRFSQIAFEHLGQRVVAVRSSRSGVHIVFQTEEGVFMLDLHSGFYLEHLVYVDSEAVFALREKGLNLESFLRALKHMTNAKASWPYLPPKVYSLRVYNVSYMHRLVYWGRKIMRRLSLYFAAKDGVMAILLGPDGSGKSTLARQLKEEFDAHRTIIPTFTFHWMPPVALPVRRRNHHNSAIAVVPYTLPPRGLLSSLVKLIYLFIRFWLGYLTNIRPLLSRTGIVIGDRYYDDLLIDLKRYRYGGPMGLARWLCRFIPRPDVFLVLDVPVEKLLERKQEVAPEELQRQVEAYRRFALETPNAFLLDGSLSPAEVTRQAREVLLDVLHRRYLDRRRVWFSRTEEKEEGEYLKKSLGLRLSKGHPTHVHLRLPDGRGYLLPLTSGRAFRKGLELYPAQGRKARLGKSVLGVLARMGIKGPGLSRVCLEEGENSVFMTLREVFRRDDLCFAVSLGMPGPHRKPVVQVLTPEGEVLGYAKVGWNEATRELVVNDAQMNSKIRGLNFPQLQVPEIVYFSQADCSTILVTRPLEAINEGSWDTKDCKNLIDILARLANHTREDRLFLDSPFWKELNGRLPQLSDYLSHYELKIVTRALEVLENRLGMIELPWVLKLGDVTKWNAAIDKQSGVLKVIDLEYGKEGWLAGWDLFRFFMEGFSIFSERVLFEYYRTVGVDPKHTHALQLAFWVDLFTEWFLAWKNANLPVSPAARDVFRKIAGIIHLLNTQLEVKQ